MLQHGGYCMLIDLSKAATQEALAKLVGVTQPTISNLMSDGKLPASGTLGDMLLAYCLRLREQAAGRMGSAVDGLDLVQARARLAILQGDVVEIRKAQISGEYAPIKLLAEVLATASQAVSERFEQLPGQLRKACPDLPPAAIDQLMATIAAARNEWARATVELVAAKLDLEDGVSEPDVEQAGLDAGREA